MEKKDTIYRPLLPPEARDSDNDCSIGEQSTLNTFKRPSVFRRWFPNVLLGSLMLWIALVIALIVLILTHKQTDEQCAAQLSIWSPALEAVEYQELDFYDAFDSTSKYRGPPTPEREEAWLNLTHKHAIEVPPDKLKYLNRTEADNLKHVPADVGTGYVALLEVFHQLHCLNLVRQYTWLLAGKYNEVPGSLSSTDVGNRMHVDHCIETLRIVLMCFADVTPFTFRLDPDAPLGERADFNSHHKCRNFDKIENWIDTKWTVH